MLFVVVFQNAKCSSRALCFSLALEELNDLKGTAFPASPERVNSSAFTFYSWLPDYSDDAHHVSYWKFNYCPYLTLCSETSSLHGFLFIIYIVNLARVLQQGRVYYHACCDAADAVSWDGWTQALLHMNMCWPDMHVIFTVPVIRSKQHFYISAFHHTDTAMSYPETDDTFLELIYQETEIFQANNF